MKAYFDRNIFGDIKKLKEISEASHEITTLQRAVDEGKLTVLLSTTVLGETLPALRHSTGTLSRELKVIFTLVEKRRMIKPADDLLREAVQSYAFARRLPDMFTKTPKMLSDFLIKGKLTRDLQEFTEGVISRSDRFADNFTKIFSEVRRIGEERDLCRPSDFQEFWKEMAPAIAEWLAKQHGVYKQCMARGIEGMLENKTVTLYTIYYSSWVFARCFGEQGTPGKVRASEMGDFFHAVQASAADIFVTKDSTFSKWLRQVQIKNLEIISFRELIEQLS